MKIRMAMIGGGTGSFIGPVHRIAAVMDGLIEISAGAFSSDPLVSEETGKTIGLDPGRVYGGWEEMITMESMLPANLRPHVISIVTPNWLHHKPVMMALEAGFHVICDKPLSISLDEALEIENIVHKKGLLFCLTHNYTGYPMVKKARELVEDGSLGEIRKVAAEYFQGWLSTKMEETGNKQAVWRADPARAGIAGSMADIGTHAFNLAEYITGLKVKSLFASLNRTLPGRKLDDDGSVILDFNEGTKGSLLVSQVATGEENNLRIRIYGSLGGLEWEQMNPNNLLVRWPDRPYEVYRTSSGYIPASSKAGLHSRLPSGHPEGFIEAFANLYRNFAIAVKAYEEGSPYDVSYDFPGIVEGVRGMRFLESVVKSNETGSWVTL